MEQIHEELKFRSHSLSIGDVLQSEGLICIDEMLGIVLRFRVQYSFKEDIFTYICSILDIFSVSVMYP